MQKTKTARVATKGKTRSAGKTGKTKQTDQTTQTKTRKPLTAAQRAHKREHDRNYRRQKAAAKRAARSGCATCDGSCGKHRDDSPPRTFEQIPPRRFDGTIAKVAQCGEKPCRECERFAECRHHARTSGFPKLHSRQEAIDRANREAAAQPTQPVLAVEPVKGQITPRPANPIAAIGEWVRTNLDRLEATKGTGIVRQTFDLPDGVAEVAVSRKVCELPPRIPDPHGWFAPGFLDALVRTFGRPVAVAVPIRCGMDFGHPSALDRVWDGVSAAVDRDWAAIKAGAEA